MQLKKGCEKEYKRRYDDIWPELVTLLQTNGISEYSIFLDETTNSLFGFLKATDSKALDTLPADPIIQRWCKYMADIMETNSDNSLVNIPLKEVFYMQ